MMRLIAAVLLTQLVLFGNCSVKCQDAGKVVHATYLTEPDLHRYEFGAEMSLLGFQPCIDSRFCTKAPPRIFVGPTLAVNVSHAIAVDADYAVTLRIDDHPATYGDGSVAGGRGSNFMMGPRLTTRTGRWGAFVGAEVGFFRWSGSRTGYDYSLSPTTGHYEPSPVYGAMTFFTGKAKAGLEYVLSDRVRARLEVGDQLIDYGQAQLAGVSTYLPTSDSWSSNATIKASVFYGAGPVIRESVGTRGKGKHRFFDRPNVLLLSASVMGQTADAVTTQRFISRNGVEGNYFAKGLVDQGWPGQIGLAVLYNGLQLGLMYEMHRFGHYRLERVLPAATAAAGAGAAYSNTR